MIITNLRNEVADLVNVYGIKNKEYEEYRGQVGGRMGEVEWERVRLEGVVGELQLLVQW